MKYFLGLMGELRRFVCAELNKLKKAIRNWFLGVRAEMEMKSAIRAVNGVHSKERAVRKYERENRQYLVLLTIPVVKRRYTPFPCGTSPSPLPLRDFPPQGEELGKN